MTFKVELSNKKCGGNVAEAEWARGMWGNDEVKLLQSIEAKCQCPCCQDNDVQNCQRNGKFVLEAGKQYEKILFHFL